ncbi:MULTISPECIES: DUF732 domain-containing protein [unclassified Microbacterium]|uniref:DUF732 domain-containing protein n=1 Tax=unclassified Microbacterium TaxID=2609290 RepID=UPI003416472B
MRTKLIALVGAVLLLAGCAPSPDAAFIAALKDKAPSVLESGSEEQAIELAHLLCENMDGGASGYDQADTMVEAGFDLGESGTFVIAAVDNYCPQHDDKVR